MRTHILIIKGLMAFLLLTSFGQSLKAQEAFYVYRNDGDFNGFFYDQVTRMNLSKIDYDGVEHDEYVIQEILTDDSLYRIPLLVIDSIGFQQPEIRLNPRLKDYRDSSEFYFELNSSEGKIDVATGGDVDEKYIASKIAPGDVLCFYINEEKELETGIDESYSTTFSVPFVCKVTEVNGTKLSYSPITDITDVFEQFISVEQIGRDSEGNVSSRVAGVNQRNRIRGSRDLTLIDLTTSGSAGYEPKKNIKFSLGINMELKSTAEVVYNIGWSSGIYTKLTIKDEFSAAFFGGADLQIDGNDNMWENSLGVNVPVAFPSFLPLFEIRPIPGMFLRAEGHATATIQSPKFIRSGTRSIVIDSKKPWKSVVSAKFSDNTTLPNDKDNKWQMMLSLNGFIQFGLKIPLRIYTCSWARELLEMSIGTDLYAGPKLSANFSMDAGQMATGNLYDALLNTNIQLTALAIDAKTSATFTGPDPTSFGEKFTEKFDILENSLNYGTSTINLLPTFEYVKFDGNDWAIAPRGNYLTCQMGIAILDSKDRFMYYSGNFSTGHSNTYSMWYTVDEITGHISDELPFGKYRICPTVYMMGHYMIAKSQGINYTHINDGVHTFYTQEHNTYATWFSKSKNYYSKIIYITGLDDLSMVSISKIGDFFSYELLEDIDSNQDNYYNAPSADDDVFKAAGYQPRKYHWKPVRVWVTNTSGDEIKNGSLTISVTRDGITKTEEYSVSYDPY